MARALLFLATIGLAVYAVADIATSDDDARLGVPRFAWVLLVVLFPVLGALIWIAVSRTRRASARQGGVAQPGPHPRPAPRGPVAPDDDPEFLWRLDQERRRREAEGGAPGADGTGSGAPDSGDDVPDGGQRS